MGEDRHVYNNNNNSDRYQFSKYNDVKKINDVPVTVLSTQNLI